MTAPQQLHESFPDPYHDAYSRTIFGFWIYLMGDLVFFGALFATYAVLRESTFGGPSSRDIFYAPSTLIQTLILLFLSFTTGLAGTAAHRKEKNRTIAYLASPFCSALLF